MLLGDKKLKEKDKIMKTNFIHNRNKGLEGLRKIIHRFQILNDMYLKELMRTNKNNNESK
jgi:hypothetical protein|tara:strand:+ start:544 stop:723 length:180 start_codon:yes stop_codon:yes gene_type:complete